MKKYFIFLVAVLVLSPSIAFASWWNPFSWNIFHRANTTSLENRIRELENKLGEKASSTQEAKLTNTSKEKDVQIPKSGTEENFANVVANLYKNINSYITGQLEILTMISTDSNRYINGIPRNADSIKNMGKLVITDEDTYDNFAWAVDEYFSIYKNDFIKQKNQIDTYSNSLRKYQNDISSQMILISSGYIPKSKMPYYTEQYKSITQGIGNSVSSISNSYESLTSAYINDKDSLAQKIYNKGVSTFKKTESYEPAPVYMPRAIHCVSNRMGNMTTIDCL